MNVIAITSYNKPALLFIYLKQIYSDLEELRSHKIRIYTEIGFDDRIRDVVAHYSNNYPIDIELKIRHKHPTCPLTGFHNILWSYVDAATESDDYIILGEDDIIPTKDYIKFNRECYEKFLSKYLRIFSVSHKRRAENERIGDPNILIGDYQSTSPSIVSVRAITEYLIPFFNTPGYFENPIWFNSFYFPFSRIPPNEMYHHDGALERIMEHFRLYALKPDHARSGHLGLAGIHGRGKAPQGTLQDQIKEWEIIMNDGPYLRSLASIPEDICVVPNWSGEPWKELILDTDRNLAKASSWWYDKDNSFKDYIECSR